MIFLFPLRFGFSDCGSEKSERTRRGRGFSAPIRSSGWRASQEFRHLVENEMSAHGCNRDRLSLPGSGRVSQSGINDAGYTLSVDIRFTGCSKLPAVQAWSPQPGRSPSEDPKPGLQFSFAVPRAWTENPSAVGQRLPLVPALSYAL